MKRLALIAVLACMVLGSVAPALADHDGWNRGGWGHNYGWGGRPAWGGGYRGCYRPAWGYQRSYWPGYGNRGYAYPNRFAYRAWRR